LPNRERTPDGRIVATIDDYSEVRKLLGEVLAAGVEASVPPHIRETVDAVHAMNEPQGVTISKLSKALHLDKSTVSRRVRGALGCGYLVNEAKERQPYRLVVGGDMPEDHDLLPDPDAARRCMLQPPVKPLDSLPPSNGGS
jgi:hypothetical protein